MITMMTAPAGAEPDAVTLQIPAIPMTWEQASIMLDATFDAWRMLSGEIDAARGDDWQWIQEILALPAHTRYIKAAGDEAMVCSAAMCETWPGRWHDLLRARVQDVIDALVSHEREIRAMDPRHVRAHALALPVRQGAETPRPDPDDIEHDGARARPMRRQERNGRRCGSSSTDTAGSTGRPWPWNASRPST